MSCGCKKVIAASYPKNKTVGYQRPKPEIKGKPIPKKWPKT